MSPRPASSYLPPTAAGLLHRAPDAAVEILLTLHEAREAQRQHRKAGFSARIYPRTVRVEELRVRVYAVVVRQVAR